MNTSTESNLTDTPKSADGYNVGQSASDKIGFYGFTPVVQPSAAIQGAITDSSGGTANLATGLAALTGTYNSALLGNSIATLAAQLEEIRSALVALGVIKGAA